MLISGSAMGSQFIPLNVGADNDLDVYVTSSGQYAYMVTREVDAENNEGELYLGNALYLQFGREEDKFIRLRDVALTSSGVVFAAEVYSDPENPDPDRVQLQAFNGPNPDFSQSQRQPPSLGLLNSLIFSPLRFSASSNGDFSGVAPGQFTVGAPRLGRIAGVGEGFYHIPSWSRSITTPPSIASIPDRIHLLDDDRVLTFSGRCIRAYSRSELEESSGSPGAVAGRLDFAGEVCADSSVLQSPNLSLPRVINEQTGDVPFCGEPQEGGTHGIYRIAGETLSYLGDAVGGSCAAVGSDGAGNVAYVTNGSNDQPAGIYFNHQSNAPFLAAGQTFQGKVIVSAVGLAVLDSGGVIALTQLRDPDTLVEERGLLFANGDTEFPPDPNEPPGDVVVWQSASDGQFTDASRWNPSEVPGSSQVAVFGPDAAYDVSFNEQTEVIAQLRVESGIPFFKSGGLQLSTGTIAQPSLLLEPNSNSPVQLFLSDGFQLQSANASLNSRGVTLVDLFLEDDTSFEDPQSRWDNQGRLIVNAGLYIGWSGGLVTDELQVGSEVGTEGSVSVSSSGAAACAEISVADFGRVSIGHAGKGTLLITEGCTVEATGDRVVGEQVGSQGFVSIDDDSSWIRFINPGQPPDLTVGRRGEGNLDIVSGAVGAKNVMFAEFAGSIARVELDRNGESAAAILGATESLIVGGAGDAVLSMLGGSQTIGRQIEIGSYAGGIGSVSVRGAPYYDNNFAATTSLVVGAVGRGFLNIREDALVMSASGVLGQSFGGEGEVEIAAGGSWILEGDLSVGQASPGSTPSECDGGELTVGRGLLRLADDGLLANVSGQMLTIDGPDSALAGTGRVVFESTIVKNCGQVKPGESVGALIVQGDLDFRSGVLLVEISGLNGGSFDELEVTGNASISGGVTRFVFRNYLPQQGDRIEFLRAGQAISLSESMRFEYEGANDGFDFDVLIEDGNKLVFVANSDAIDQLFGDGFGG